MIRLADLARDDASVNLVGESWEASIRAGTRDRANQIEVLITLSVPSTFPRFAVDLHDEMVRRDMLAPRIVGGQLKRIAESDVGVGLVPISTIAIFGSVDSSESVRSGRGCLESIEKYRPWEELWPVNDDSVPVNRIEGFLSEFQVVLKSDDDLFSLFEKTDVMRRDLGLSYYFYALAYLAAECQVTPERFRKALSRAHESQDPGELGIRFFVSKYLSS